MAQWGIAMSYFHTIWGPPTRGRVRRRPGGGARRRRALGAPTRARARLHRRDRRLSTRAKRVPHATRVAAYEQAMAGVAERNPDDHEAAIFHALAILGVAYNSPPDKTYARQKQAAEILNRLLPLEPDHPGHRALHDPLVRLSRARRAGAARRRAPTRRSRPRRRTRCTCRRTSSRGSACGRSRSSPTSPRPRPRRRGWRARTRARPRSTRCTPWTTSSTPTCRPARTRRRASSWTRSLKVTSLDAPVVLGRLRARGDPGPLRARAPRLEGRRGAHACGPRASRGRSIPTPRRSSISRARVGAARIGRPRRGARGARQARPRSRPRSRARRDSTGRRRSRSSAAPPPAGSRAREKKDDEALTLLRSAADLEDSTDKHPVTPGSILPAREQLARPAAELGQARPRRSPSTRRRCARAPARFNSYAGAARAAAARGDKQKAKDYRTGSSRSVEEHCPRDRAMREGSEVARCASRMVSADYDRERARTSPAE